MPLFKKFLFFFLALIILVLLVVSAYFLYHRFQNPIRAIAPTETRLKQVLTREFSFNLSDEQRIYQDTQIILSSADTIRFTISIPKNYKGEKLPVVLIIGGLEIGRESLNYIPYHGRNIVIAYEYPAHPLYWYTRFSLSKVEVVRQAVMKVPGQVYFLFKWARQQSWADTSRINLLGYSFGALFIPAIQRVIEVQGLTVQNTVIAYGGVNIYELLRTNLYFLKSWQRRILARMAAWLLHPIEPSLYLPDLNGRFLVINGIRDQQIPFVYAQQLQKMLPEPKTIINLNEGHMHPSKPQLTRKIVEISREWLLKQGAINP